MRYAGIDLHKRILVVCILNEKRQIVVRQKFACSDEDAIIAFFKKHRPFRAVMEATAGYEWLWRLLEPLADSVVLAHPTKLRVIAETCTKTDKIDALKLAELLAKDSIPQAYRPSPREHDHRMLVRSRCRVQQRITALKCRIRHLLAGHNADRADLFTREGEKHVKQVPLSRAERFVFESLQAEMKMLGEQLDAFDRELARFAKEAPTAEKEARAVLKSIPSVGPVTIDVVLSELGNVRRFSSAKQVVAYAGLAPGLRESAGKSRQLTISKAGSRILRWALVQLAWRLVRRTGRWRTLFERVEKRAGKKKAIIAVALRVLRVMVSLLKSGQPYRHAA